MVPAPPWRFTQTMLRLAQAIVDSRQTAFLGVNPDNIPAIRLYDRLGFRHPSTLHLNFVKRRWPRDQPNLCSPRSIRPAWPDGGTARRLRLLMR